MAASYLHPGQPAAADPMPVEESLNNRAWPFLQDAPPQPQQMVYEHASAGYEAATNNGLSVKDAAHANGHGAHGSGWLLGLRSFLPMTPYGGRDGAGVALPAGSNHPDAHTGADGDAAAHQPAQGAPIQWLPGGDVPMRSPSEGTGWSRDDSALMVIDTPPRPAEQALDWGPQQGAASGAEATSAQPRSPTGRGREPARPLAHAGLAEAAPPPQPDAPAEARGGSGGDGSLVSSATSGRRR